MKYKIRKKESNSSGCFICGKENPGGVHADFYSLENGESACVFTARHIHEGHPGILHGGIICSVLDEAVGRSIISQHPEISSYTVELNVKFLKTIPSQVQCIALSRVDEIREKVYLASGEIYLENGQIAATCQGTYFIIRPDMAHESSTYHEVIHSETDLDVIEIPDFIEPPKKHQ